MNRCLIVASVRMEYSYVMSAQDSGGADDLLPLCLYIVPKERTSSQREDITFRAVHRGLGASVSATNTPDHRHNHTRTPVQCTPLYCYYAPLVFDRVNYTVVRGFLCL